MVSLQLHNTPVGVGKLITGTGLTASQVMATLSVLGKRPANHVLTGPARRAQACRDCPGGWPTPGAYGDWRSVVGTGMLHAYDDDGFQASGKSSAIRLAGCVLTRSRMSRR